MSNTLTKHKTAAIVSPSSPGSAGSPYIPAYWETVRVLEPVSETTFVGNDEYGQPVFATTRRYITVTKRIYHPAEAAVAPVPPTPATLEYQFNLGWNAGARSVGSIAGDGSAQFRVNALAVGVVAGLNGADTGPGYAEIDHAIYFASGLFAAMEGGAVKTAFQPFTADDVFTLLRSGTAVNTYKGSELIYTSGVASYGTAFLDASLYCGDDAIYDAAISDAVPAEIGNSGYGVAVLGRLDALGSDEAYVGGTAILPALGAEAGGAQDSGGTAVLGRLEALGSDLAYTGGTAVLGRLGAAGADAGELSTAMALGHAVLPALMSVGVGEAEMPGVYDPATSLGDPLAYWQPSTLQGGTVTIVSGTGAGQSRALVDNNFQVLLLQFDDEWDTLPDETSQYVVTDALGNVLHIGYAGARGNMLPSLQALGSDLAYAGGTAVLPALRGEARQEPKIDGYLLASMPSPKLKMSGKALAPNQIIAAMPAPVVQISGGGALAAIMPRPTVQIEGTSTPVASITASMPRPAASISGLAGAVGAIAAVMPRPTLASFGGGVLSVTLQDGFKVQIEGVAGSVGGITATMPLFEVEIEAQAIDHGQIIATMPMLHPVAAGAIEAVMPMARLSIAGSAVVAMEREAYAVNLLAGGSADAPTGGEVTRYTNFPFDWIVRHHDKYYGVSSTGLYLLGGDTDLDAPIPWAFRTGITDFDTRQKKTLVSAYLGGDVPAGAAITTLAGDKSDTSYSYPIPAGAGGETVRTRFGRGLQARYFAVEMADAAGGALALDTIDLEIQTLKRTL